MQPSNDAMRSTEPAVWDVITPRFPIGRMLATPGALTAFAGTHEDPLEFLERHVSGDWGDLDDFDKAENERSLADGCRILSSYHLADSTKIWIITEADRSATTILLPAEY